MNTEKLHNFIKWIVVEVQMLLAKTYFVASFFFLWTSSQTTCLSGEGRTYLVPELAKTSQNQPKRPKTSQTDPSKWQNNPKRPKISNLGKSRTFYKFSFFKLQAKIPKFGCFGPRSINFLIFPRNFVLTLFWRCWFQIRHWFLKILSLNTQIWVF